jgi:CDP-paratose 2-epimerase
VAEAAQRMLERRQLDAAQSDRRSPTQGQFVRRREPIRTTPRPPVPLPLPTMPVCIVTGSGGLIGSEAVSYFIESGYDVVGIENDMRARFFGPDASTAHVTAALTAMYPDFLSIELDIRDADGLDRLFSAHCSEIELVVHTAAQPSHDWAATDPQTDFTINANGTLNLLEATRRHCPGATFIFCSTNKVYGDRPNDLPLVETPTRLELPAGHRYHRGIDTSMSIDRSKHSLFGVSKVAADLMVQEYGCYFELPTACFRGGCLTGPNHAGARLHGFLSYLMRCTITGERYTVYGYGAKQVRDNIHGADLVRAFDCFHRNPKAGAVYNIGGGREANCSVLEAIDLCEEIAGRELSWTLSDQARIGDHKWWISDLGPFQADYPQWSLTYDVAAVLRQIHDSNVERWAPVGGRAQ